MISRSITYTDFDGNKVTEKFHFNLTETELGEVNLALEGGILEYSKKVQETQDSNGIIHLIKLLVSRSYGELVELGNGKKRFLKNEDMANSFINSDAYSKLFIELANNEQSIIDFMLGIIPSNMASEVAKEMKKEELKKKESEVLVGEVESISE